MRLASGLAAVAIAACGAIASPPGPALAESTLETISRLEAEGYLVNIDKVGKGPIHDCIVTSVRNPNTITRFVRVQDRLFGSDRVPVIVSRTVNVSLQCPG